MQVQKAHPLERILFVAIACTIVFIALCKYTYLVYIYESHWPPQASAPHLGAEAWPATSRVYHAQWAPIDSQLPAVPGRFLLSLQDRHASGIVYFAQSTSGSAAAAIIEAQVEASYESEKALGAETGTT